MNGYIIQQALCNPTVETRSATSITETAATLNGEITDDGGASIDERGFLWGKGDILTDFTTAVTISGDYFSFRLTGLEPDTFYSFMVYAKNSAGTGEGNILSFRTLKVVQKPTVETRYASSIMTTAAFINGRILDDGGSTIIERRFDWGTTPTCEDDWTADVTVVGNNFFYFLTDLTPGTTYYFRAWAKNSAGWSHGNVLHFTTQSAQKADLIVEDIWVEPDPPTAGGSTKIWFRIKNQGTGDAIETFFLEFYFDGTYVGHVYKYGLTTGSTSTSYWWRTWPADTNQHTIRGVVDPDNAVPESNEGNNERSEYFSAVQPPSIDFSPSSHNFGSVDMGSCSSEYSFTLTNTGGGTATGSVSRTGTHASQFTITQGSGSFSLGAGASKTIKVKFCPTSTGSKSATLYADGLNCNDDSSSLSGTGTQPPSIDLSPSSHSFGNVQVGSCSSEYSFTLTNTGGGTATGSVSLTGSNANQFTITSGSGSFSLGAGASKTIKVKFCPTSTGSKSATLYADGSNCNDDSSSLSGTGTQPPSIDLSPSSHNYGTMEVGSCSSEYSFTLTNTGGGTATGTVSLTGTHASQFTITQGSGSFSLGTGASKTIKVKFCPTSTGSKSATLYADGSNCNDDSTSLSGTGTQAPAIDLSPSSHNFGNIEVGSCSSEFSFTLTNTGGGTATGSVSRTGTHATHFTITQGSGSFSLGAGASKTIKVKFCPTSTGAKTATLYADGSNCNDDSSSLSGTGTQAPSIDLSPSSRNFGSVDMGQCSSEYSFTLTNTGGGTATGSVSLTGTHASQFTITQGSGSFSLGAGSSKTIKVKFCPTSTGSKTATLYADGSNCNDDSSSLSGTGYTVGPIELTPSSHPFGDVQVGECSSEYSFTLTNTGGGTATGSVSLTGTHASQFTITQGSGSFSLGAGASKTIKVKFCPASTGAKSATLFADGSNCNDDSSSLSGTGTQAQRTITFYTDPSDGGSIIFDGPTYNNGQSTTKTDGNYPVSANPASNYEFDHWSTTGGVSVANSYSQSTTATVSGDGSIKAWFNYVPPEDTTPPSAVTDLATTDPTSNTIKLTWTAPGDDGNTGTATTYDIRYLEGTPVTESDWASAIQCTDEPSPNPAGSAEAFVVTGLSPDTTYYFALKTADEVPNWSPISNSPSGTTKGAAITATREISPQQVMNGSTFTVTVTITANQTIYALILDEAPPTGWSVTPVQNDGATFKESEIKWLWTASLSAGDSKTVIYNVTIPSDTTPGDYTITGNVSAYGIEPITVGGDNTITVITDWNPWDDDGIIIDSEIQEAVYHWLTDTPKNGHLITDEEIQALVFLWLTG